MADFSLNLPSWARQLGYRAEGDLGTFGSLFLRRDGKIVKVWRYDDRQPNIFEMEELIRKHESKDKEASPKCQASH